MGALELLEQFPFTGRCTLITSNFTYTSYRLLSLFLNEKKPTPAKYPVHVVTHIKHLLRHSGQVTSTDEIMTRLCSLKNFDTSLI